MSAQDIDDYLATVAEPHRSTLVELRSVLRELLPDAEECISYAVPCFKVNGKGVAGFAAYKNHNSYFPFSGGVFKRIPDAIAAYTTTSGAMHFATDAIPPRELIELLVSERQDEIAEGYHR